MRKFNISNEDLATLKPYMNVDEFEELQDFQIALDDIIISKFIDDEPTDESRILERIYDRVYMLN